ncbi:TcdA/TcdB pore-forming domain-containing protein [Providencia burhodogranariea]|uniref:Peptidase C80 domain-containing protein n=1 Tax=Providencia burhodogranariea DSM 19968 TaxID=1141662 RepID=K8WL63_9GAMM|nr:TcdA/TcdB pore-forming domain-containing protein [Providencia burhodogranariea]EKT58227.1 hypothetical protein OOA_13912 [Providencia burhodogranariea DSM 19968]
MVNLPIKDDTKKQFTLANQQEQASDEKLNFQLINAYSRGNKQSSWQAQRVIPNFSRVWTRDSLVQHAAVPRKLKGSSYQAILAILDALHNSSGTQQIENALILKNQIRHYQEHHASSERNPALIILNQQVDKELFSSPLKDQVIILNVAQQNPQLASQMYQSVFNEALGTHTTRSVDVPENLHFIWQGKFGAIQQDYINAWHQTNPDYRIKVWYDPQALLVHELRKQIEQFAHRGQMLNETGYFEQILQLQNKAYRVISTGIGQQDKTFDQAATEFMINQLGSKKDVLERIRKDNQASYAAFAQKARGSIQLADINTLNLGVVERQYYYQELALRQNLAAASDIVRLEALYQQGGIYIDVDFLPAFKDDLFSHSINKDIARLGRLPNGSDTAVINLVKTQLVLDQLANNFPSRQLREHTEYYQNYIAKFRARSSEHASLIDRMKDEIQQRGQVSSNFFQPLAAQRLSSQGIRIADINGFSNAVIVSPARNSILKVALKQFAKNYEYLEQAGLIDVSKISEIDEKSYQYILASEERDEISSGHGYRSFSNQGFNYRLDGVLPNSRATIYVTGPIALHQAFDRFSIDVIQNPIERSNVIDLQFTEFNQYTEEEIKHSWLADNNLKIIDLFSDVIASGKSLFGNISQNSKLKDMADSWSELCKVSGSQLVGQVLILREQLQNYLLKYQYDNAINTQKTFLELQILNQQIDESLFERRELPESEIMQLAKKHPKQAARIYQSIFNEAQLQGAPVILSGGVVERGFHIVIQHPEWFNRQDKRALLDCFLARFTAERLLKLPESIFTNITRQQAENYFSKVLPDTLNDNEFLAYLKIHSGVYRQLSASVDVSPLLSRYSQFSSAQRKQVPPEALLSLATRQAQSFFNGMNDDDFIDYVKQHQPSYQHLVEHIGWNPLWPRSTKFSLEQQIQVPPEALLLIAPKELKIFFSALSTGDLIAYVKKHRRSYGKFVKRLGSNPLLSHLESFSTAQRIDLPTEALQGITFKQARLFFTGIDSDLITAAYLEQYQQGVSTLDSRTILTLLAAVINNPSRKTLLMTMEAIPAESHQSDNQVNAFVLNALLGHAVRLKDKEFVKLLIEHTQADVQSPLVIPNTSKAIEILVSELPWSINESPLFLAIKTQQIDLVKLLLEHQPLSNNDRFEWLRAAINNHDNATLRLLLDAGINSSSNRKIGGHGMRQTALTEAVGSGDITLVNTLLRYGVQDEGGALLLAISHNDIALVERFFEVSLYQHLSNKENIALYKQASEDAKSKQILLAKRYKDSDDISERAIIRDAFERSKNISVIISAQEKGLKRQISTKEYELLYAVKPKPIDNNVLDSIASFDEKLVNYWDEPLISPQKEDHQTRFDGQLIIQLENDAVVRESAIRLVGKHPKTSALIQLDRQGNFRVWHLNDQGGWVDGFPEKLTTNGSLRWQIVGHGRGSDEMELSHQMLGGRSAETLQKQLIEFSSVFGISTSPERISLVGCSLAGQDQKNSYLHQFVSFLTKNDLYPSSVAAYTTKVMINEDNQKRLTQIGEKVTMSRDNGEWVIERIPGKNDSSVSQRKLLDALDQGLGFELGMAQLYLKNQLSDTEWLPVFQTLKEDASQEGLYSLEFINKEDPTESKILIINDSRIANFIHGYDRHLISLKTHINMMKGRVRQRSGTVPEATGVHGLNTAFIIQTLFNKHSRDGIEDDALPENLRTALKLHSYTNGAQMGWGTVEDTFRYVRLWKDLSNESQSLGRTLKVLSRASPVGDLGLNLLSIGLNGYELAYAQNDAQRAEYGTQLAFDLAGLVDVVIGLGANSIGATTVAGFAGSLGVPLAGLGIGISALVQGTQVHIEKTKAVGRYFAHLDEGYQKGGYDLAEVKGEDGTVVKLWKNTPGIVISTLDLRNHKLIFGNTWIYKTYIYGLGSGYTNHITWLTPKSVNKAGKHKVSNPKERVINIREGIGHAAAIVPSVLSSNIPLVLPDTPQYYMDYSYETFPGSTIRDDWGFEVLRRLERRFRDNNDNFSFDFYNFPSERAISELSFEYLATPVVVLLDDIPRTIIMPSLSEEAKGKMAYRLQGGNSTYYISIQEGAVLKLTQGSNVTQWVLDIRTLADTKNPRFDSHGRLQIGQAHISFSDDFQGKLNLLNDDGVLAVDVKKKTITLEKLNVNANRFNNWQDLHEHLIQISKIDSHHQPFIPVEGYRTLDRQWVGRAFYEVERSRFIYTNEPEEAEFLSDIQLAKVEGDQAWFYRDDKIWLVDITTGNVLLEYLPLNRSMGRAFIKAIADKPSVAIIPTKSRVIIGSNDTLYFIVEYQYDSGPVSYVWQLTKQAQQLIAITGDEKDIQEILLLVAKDDRYASLAQFSSELTIPATGGEQIHLLGRRNNVNYHLWAKKSEETGNYQAFLRMNLTDAPEDIQQVSVVDRNKTRYYFYSPQLKKLYFQPDNGITVKDDSMAHEIKSSIQILFLLQGQLIAQSEDGILWEIGIQDKLNLMGVTIDWLLKHRQDLITALRELAEREDTLPAIRVQGLTDTENKVIMTWYDVAAEEIIQGGAGIDVTHDIHYLGLSSDGDQAWLYDNTSGQLYRQPLLQENLLTVTELGQSLVEIPPSECWLAEPYRSVVSVGDKLRLTTEQGAIFLLEKSASPHDQPLLIAWQVTAATSEIELAAAVERLRGNVILAPAIRWLSEKGQAPAWYLTEQKILLHAENLNADHDLRYLGQAAGNMGSYIHDQFTGELWQISGSRLPISVGSYRFILINENFPFKGELVLQYALSDQVLNRKLPLLEETDRLAITNHADGAHYLFDIAILNHYEQIILDDRGKQSVILLPDHGEDGFKVRLHGQDLVWHVPQSKSQLWVVGIEQAGESGMMFKIGDIPELPAKQLLQSMSRLQAVGSADDDWFKLSFAEGHYQLNEVELGHIMNQYQEMVGTDADNNYRVGEHFSHSVITDSGGERDTLSLEYEKIKPSQLMLQRQGDDLEIAVIGSGRVTIKNQFKQGEHSAIETLKLNSEEQRWQYSLTDAMSSFNTGEIFGLSTTGSLLSKHNLKMPICNIHGCHNNNL